MLPVFASALSSWHETDTKPSVGVVLTAVIAANSNRASVQPCFGCSSASCSRKKNHKINAETARSGQ